MLYLELKNLTFIKVTQNFQSDLILKQSEARENSHYFQNWHNLLLNSSKLSLKKKDVHNNLF